MERPPKGQGHAGVPGAGDGLLGQDLWAPQSSNANPLDYNFWPHIKFKACELRHPNIDALNQE
ncbi:Putative LOC100197221 [Caligus rogercresseyi]|uniref:LOC100197221 n=1 Tax=Caligus rogercresseyi TaxID=217165 RepID=A0A7T8JXT3_CALRO|nr:Putative LOC100197221 [Caligus rogercresseyi]